MFADNQTSSYKQISYDGTNTIKKKNHRRDSYQAFIDNIVPFHKKCFFTIKFTAFVRYYK